CLEKGIKVFGPSKQAARLEGSKKYSKEFMLRHKIPTADFSSFTIGEKSAVLNYLNKTTYPVVIKTSGLAAGKGVAICPNLESASSTIKDYFEHNKFGKSGHEIVIEQFLEGEEASIFVVSSGNDYVILPSSQDHKRAFDNDYGPNTGGMGAYSPAPVVTDEILNSIEQKIIKPTIDGLIKDHTPYIGCIYIGVMIKGADAKVVEYNCRFGDPEAQVVLPNLEGDFLELIYSAACGKINKDAVRFENYSSLCVVAASGGYPEEYKKGFEIHGLDNISKDCYVYHAGTKIKNEKLVTDGGRVLAITSSDKSGDVSACREKVYAQLAKIKYDGIHYRNDIGFRALGKK
ncbi:MAG: phosphoribosylamine--glycine ligase, partial [Melioribacteraceae bacterium]|nr:phosphoribosylamine--glycine ligase [Melioribacteraceae bacterium]